MRLNLRDKCWTTRLTGTYFARQRHRQRLFSNSPARSLELLSVSICGLTFTLCQQHTEHVDETSWSSSLHLAAALSRWHRSDTLKTCTENWRRLGWLFARSSQLVLTMMTTEATMQKTSLVVGWYVTVNNSWTRDCSICLQTKTIETCFDLNDCARQRSGGSTECACLRLSTRWCSDVCLRLLIGVSYWRPVLWIAATQHVLATTYCS